MTRPLPPKRVLEICDRALEIAPEERDTFLDDACAGDSRLRAQVDSVLIAIDDAGDFLDADLEAPAASALVGQKIGPYEIEQTLGEGGMGAVYLAQRRTSDYTQKVALKVVRGHLMTPSLLQRFQAERKILAGLSHPYIAGLIDGGTTQDGTPYLVMEYIDGVPIDRYCDDHSLSISQRLKLVQKVALAVHYAHQNLVVHRDLKPSNVLVTPDGIPKLLDFGIAKLIEADRPIVSDLTAVGGRAMTPEYASPEQILDGKATTSSDVYTLGVLTYELLTGRRPYALETTSHRELLKQIEGLSVPRPSTRVKTTDSPDTLERLAALRATTPGRLERALRGDLDNILLMALRREPERRYVSVSQFSEDLQRYLDGRPVLARPDTLAYRATTFVKRNWLATGSAAVIVLSLLGGALAFAWQAREASVQRDIAEQKAESAEMTVDFLKTVLWSANPWDGSEREATVVDVLRYAEENLFEAYDESSATKAYLVASLGEIYVGRGEYEKAHELSRKAHELLEENGLSDDPASAFVYRILGLTHSEMGNNEEALASLKKAIALHERQPQMNWRRLAAVYNVLGATESTMGNEPEAQAWMKKALEMHDSGQVDDPDQLIAILNNLALSVGNEARYDEAIEILERAVREGKEHEIGDAAVGTFLSSLAAMKGEQEMYDEAVADYREALALQIGALGEEHPQIAMTATSLAGVFERMGEFDEAAATLEPALARVRQSLPDQHPITAYAMNIMGQIRCRQDRTGEGIALLREAVAARQATYPEGHWAIDSTRNSLGACLSRAGDFALAEELLLDSYAKLREKRGEDQPLTGVARKRLAELYDRWGRPDQAAQYR